MEIPVKKLKNGFEMPVFGIGTWMMGGDKKRNPNNDDARDIQAVRNAIEAGVTHIDTAENYAEGQAEKLVGHATRGYDRAKLFIASKVSSRNLKHDDVLVAAEQSLMRLQTDYMDLYMIHAPNPEVPIQETMRALDRLKGEGAIKNIGVSNFTMARLEEAQSHTNNKIVANQLHLNLRFRETEKAGLLDYCAENDVMFVAWRPVQKGILSKRGIPILDRMTDKYGKTPSQVAINWLISQPNVVTLSKMSNKEHLEENLGAIGWKMEQGDIEKLRSDFPDQEDILDAVPLI